MRRANGRKGVMDFVDDEEAENTKEYNQAYGRPVADQHRIDSGEPLL
jgi:hypothetical protein